MSIFSGANNPGVDIFQFTGAEETQILSILSAGVPAENLLSTTTGINAKTTGTTVLYTVPFTKSARVSQAVVRVTTADTITGVPTLGVGIAAGEDDIFFPAALTGLNATTKIFVFTAIGTLAVGQPNDVIKLGIDTGATATTMTIAIDLIGYLI